MKNWLIAAMVVAWILLATLALGCATIGVRGEVTEKPGLAQAVAFTWDFYGRKDPPPKVRVVEGDELSCTDPNSGEPGFPVILGAEDGTPVQACRKGFTFLPTEVSVSWTGQPWSRTSLAHELMHVRLVREGLVFDHHPGKDQANWRPEFRDGGEVAQANARLEAQGL